MPLILSLDIASVTGVALYDTAKPVSAIEALTIRLKEKDIEAKAAELGQKVLVLIREHGPDFISFEAPLKMAVRFPKKGGRQGNMIEGPSEATINPQAIIVPNQLTGAVMCAIGIKGKPWCMLSVETWRKQFLGFGRKKGWKRPDYKKAARDKCDQLRIPVTTDDAADAVGIAIATPAESQYRMWAHRLEAA